MVRHRADQDRGGAVRRGMARAAPRPSRFPRVAPERWRHQSRAVHSLRHDHAPTQILAPPTHFAPNATPSWLLPNHRNGELAQRGRTESCAGSARGAWVWLILDLIARKIASRSRCWPPIRRRIKKFSPLPARRGTWRQARTRQHRAQFDAGHDDASGLYYIVLEYIDGPSAMNCSTGPANCKSATRSTSSSTLPALGACPRTAIIHRDIKPGNILLTLVGPGEALRPWSAKRRGKRAISPTPARGSAPRTTCRMSKQ